MKVSFNPLVVLIVSTALVDAFAENPGQVSSALAMEKPPSEINVKKAATQQDFEVESKKYKPEDAKPAPPVGDLDADEKIDYINNGKTSKYDVETDNDKVVDNDEEADNIKTSKYDEEIDSVKVADEDEEVDIAKNDDDDEEVNNAKTNDDEKEFEDVKVDDDEKKADDEKEFDDVKVDDDEKIDDDEKEIKDVENLETEVEKFKHEPEEPVDSLDEAEAMKNFSISTVYTTVTSTVTDCESTVTVCPEIGSVVTKTVSLYTTICPETTTMPSFPLVTVPAIPEPSNVSYLTKTVETTLWYTVTECPPQEADCFVGLKTSSVATYLDVHPMTHDVSPTVNEHGPYPTTTPYATGFQTGNLSPPQSNVTMPAVPLNPTFDGASAKSFDGSVLYFGLAVAATATIFLQGWH